MKLKKTISATSKYWYIFLAAFAVFEILNYGVLSYYVPGKVCFWISAFLIVLLSVYLSFLGAAIYDNIVSFLNNRKQTLDETLANLKEHIDELDKENKQLSEKLADALCNDIKNGNAEVISAVHTDAENNKRSIITTVQENGDEVKKLVADNSDKVIAKSDALMDAQNKSTEKIISDNKNGVSAISELVENKASAASEQTSTLFEKLSSDFQDQTREKTDNILSKIDDSIGTTLETINNNHKQAEELSNSNYTNIIASFANVEIKMSASFNENEAHITALNEKASQELKDAQSNIENTLLSLQEKISAEHAEETNKTCEIIELCNTIQSEQSRYADETNSALSDLKYSYEVQTDKLNETLTTAIEDATVKETLALDNVKDAILIDLENVKNAHTSQAEQIELNLEEKADKIIETTEVAIDKYVAALGEEISSKLFSFKKEFDDNSNNTQNKLAELHADTSKLINSVLDNIDKGIEANERCYDLINNQLAELFTTHKQGVLDVLEEVELNKLEIEEDLEKLAEYMDSQSEAADKKNEEILRNLNSHYAKSLEKIDNLQFEVLNLSKMVSSLENIHSSTKKDSPKEVQRDKTEKPGQKQSERVEEHRDPASGALVRNHYSQNKLSLSEMIVSGKKTYDLQYSPDGKPQKSRSYNKQGDLISEIEFHKNGQVKTRKEFIIRDGKKETTITHFDEKGNKIK